MNTEERLFLLNKFSRHLDQKIRKIQKDKNSFLKNLQNVDINFEALPKIEIVNDLAVYHKDVDQTINDAYEQISNVMQNLSRLKNRKQNTHNLNDILASISMVKQFSFSLKAQNTSNPSQIYKDLSVYFEIRSKAKYCDNMIKQIDQQIVKIQQKYKKQFDAQLTKTNSSNIKQLSKILELIKVNKKKIETKESQKKIKEQNESKKQISEKSITKQKQISTISTHKHSQSLSQISQFYVAMVKKELLKYEQQLFSIPIVSSNPNQMSYAFFQIIKNSLKIVATIIETYQSNIINLQSVEGLHIVIVNVFKYCMQNLIFEILVRQKRYYEIDKISISRNKLTIKASQYKILKNYFKEFNAIWNQIQRFRIHLYHYIQDKQMYTKKDLFNKQLTDIINSSKFIEFNYEIILYFEAFFRHQLDRLLKKNPFILSLWQLDEQFFKDVRQKNEYKSNLSGQDFIQEMITKFSQGIKKSFETLNLLIVSALINFVNHNLIYEDSFYAFNQLLTRFVGKISQNKAIEGVVILLNTVSTYPKAIKSSFQELQIPQEIPKERIQNQISQLIHGAKQKTGQFIVEAFDKLLNQDFIIQKLSQQQSNQYQDIVNKLFQNFQKDLLQLFVYKMSKVHVQIILQRQFKEKYSHMEVLNLQKQIRNIISFYQSKSHSIRQNFRKIMDYIEVLLIESENTLKKLIEEWKNKYDEAQLKGIWKLRAGN